MKRALNALSRQSLHLAKTNGSSLEESSKAREKITRTFKNRDVDVASSNGRLEYIRQQAKQIDIQSPTVFRQRYSYGVEGSSLQKEYQSIPVSRENAIPYTVQEAAHEAHTTEHSVFQYTPQEGESHIKKALHSLFNPEKISDEERMVKDSIRAKLIRQGAVSVDIFGRAPLIQNKDSIKRSEGFEPEHTPVLMDVRQSIESPQTREIERSSEHIRQDVYPMSMSTHPLEQREPIHEHAYIQSNRPQRESTPRSSRRYTTKNYAHLGQRMALLPEKERRQEIKKIAHWMSVTTANYLSIMKERMEAIGTELLNDSKYIIAQGELDASTIRQNPITQRYITNYKHLSTYNMMYSSLMDSAKSIKILANYVEKEGKNMSTGYALKAIDGILYGTTNDGKQIFQRVYQELTAPTELTLNDMEREIQAITQNNSSGFTSPAKQLSIAAGVQVAGSRTLIKSKG